MAVFQNELIVAIDLRPAGTIRHISAVDNIVALADDHQLLSLAGI